MSIDGKILLLRRKAGSIGGGKLDLPGGMLEEGERPADGLLREIKEETGLDAIINQPIFTHGAIPKKIGRYTVWIWFKARSQSSQVVLDQENSEALWLTPEEALKYDDDTLPQVHKQAIRAAQ